MQVNYVVRIQVYYVAAHHGSVRAGLHRLRKKAPLLAFEAELWSAAACCRFGASQLAGGELCSRSKLPRASSRGGRRQQAAALQSFARPNRLCGASGTVILFFPTYHLSDN